MDLFYNESFIWRYFLSTNQRALINSTDNFKMVELSSQVSLETRFQPLRKWTFILLFTTRKGDYYEY